MFVISCDTYWHHLTCPLLGLSLEENRRPICLLSALSVNTSHLLQSTYFQIVLKFHTKHPQKIKDLQEEGKRECQAAILAQEFGACISISYVTAKATALQILRVCACTTAENRITLKNLKNKQACKNSNRVGKL